MSDFIEPEYKEPDVIFDKKYLVVKAENIVFSKKINDKIEKLEKQYYTATCRDFVAAIVIKNDKLLLVNQYRVPLRKFNTEFVAGIIENNETPEQAIRKELLEEAGIKANNLIKLGTTHPLVGINAVTGHIFLVTDFDEVERRLEEYELFTNLTINWMDISEFISKIKSNELNDGNILSAWALYMLNKGE
jgi:ADP-ribose pyrophosphatase